MELSGAGVGFEPTTSGQPGAFPGYANPPEAIL